MNRCPVSGCGMKFERSLQMKKHLGEVHKINQNVSVCYFKKILYNLMLLFILNFCFINLLVLGGFLLCLNYLSGSINGHVIYFALILNKDKI